MIALHFFQKIARIFTSRPFKYAEIGFLIMPLKEKVEEMLKNEIIKITQKNPDLCITAISRKLGVNQSQLSLFVNEMEKEGLLQFVKVGNVKLVRVKK